MSRVFADTFHYLAFLNPADDCHERATRFTESFDGRMVRSAWVRTELADAMDDPLHRQGFTEFLEALRADPQVDMLPASQALWDAELALFAARPDKDWSLTDCISFVVMEDEAIHEALSGDRHFEQAGFIALLK